MDRRFRPSLGQQVRPGLGGVDEEELGDLVGDDPVDLLRHRAVEAAQPRLHVPDGQLELRRGQGGGERRVDVARDEHEIRLQLEQHGLQPLDHPCDLLGVGPGADAEHAVGVADAELLEEDRGHLAVVVLAGVDEHVLEAVGTATQLGHDRRRLHHVRARPHDRDDAAALRHGAEDTACPAGPRGYAAAS